MGTTVAPEDATTFPHHVTDTGPIGTPVLDFIDEFVVAFVNKLDQMSVDLHGLSLRTGSPRWRQPGVNLALRLGRRDPNTAWIAKAVVAWSPAPVWKPMVQNELRRKGPEFCETEFRRVEEDSSRARFFNLVYDHVPWPAVIKQQPEYWYREGWNAKDFEILLSRIGRREIYNENYRRWHWRVACEQLIFSHFNNTTHGDTTTPLWYQLNTVRTLLVAGEVDNYPYVGIYDGTKSLAAVMTVPGRLLLIKDSGHSIHFEHPRDPAYQILRFLTARSMEITGVTRENGRVEAVGGTDRTDPAVSPKFTLGRGDCVAAIRRGDEFYVTDARGGQVLVHSRSLGSGSGTSSRPPPTGSTRTTSMPCRTAEPQRIEPACGTPRRSLRSAASSMSSSNLTPSSPSRPHPPPSFPRSPAGCRRAGCSRASSAGHGPALGLAASLFGALAIDRVELVDELLVGFELAQLAQVAVVPGGLRGRRRIEAAGRGRGVDQAQLVPGCVLDRDRRLQLLVLRPLAPEQEKRAILLRPAARLQPAHAGKIRQAAIMCSAGGTLKCGVHFGVPFSAFSVSFARIEYIRPKWMSRPRLPFTAKPMLWPGLIKSGGFCSKITSILSAPQ